MTIIRYVALAADNSQLCQGVTPSFAFNNEDPDNFPRLVLVEYDGSTSSCRVADIDRIGLQITSDTPL